MPYAISKKGVVGTVTDELASKLKARGIIVYATAEEAQSALNAATSPVPERKGFAISKDGKVGTVTGKMIESLEKRGIPVYETLEEAQAAAVVPPSDGSGSQSRREQAGKAMALEDEKKVAAERLSMYQKEHPTISAILPYGAAALANDGSSITAAARDVFSLPGRAISSFTMGNNLGKTSEEFSAEGDKVGAILTDPATGAILLAAPVAELGVGTALAGTAIKAGMNPIVAGGLGTVLSAVPAGYAAQSLVGSPYGSDSMLMDIAASMTGPVLSAVVGAPSKLAARKLLSKEFAKKGITDVPNETLDLVYDNLYAKVGVGGKGSQAGVGKYISDKATEKAEGLLTAPARPAPTSGILKGLSTGYAPDIDLSGVRETVLATMQKGPKAGRSVKQAQAAVAKVTSFEKEMNMLNKMVGDGSIGDAEYRGQVAELLRNYSDVPEIMDYAKGSLTGDSERALWANTIANVKAAVLPFSKSGRGEVLDELNKAVSEANKADVLAARTPVRGTLTSMQAGELLQAPGIYRKTNLPLGVPSSISAAKGVLPPSAGWVGLLPQAAGAGGTAAGQYIFRHDYEDNVGPQSSLIEIPEGDYLPPQAGIKKYT